MDEGEPFGVEGSGVTAGAEGTEGFGCVPMASPTSLKFPVPRDLPSGSPIPVRLGGNLISLSPDLSSLRLSRILVRMSIFGINETEKSICSAAP